MIEQPGGTNLETEPVEGKYIEAFKSIFFPIQEYHEKLGYPRVDCTIDERVAQHRELCLALSAEVTELLDSMPWKPWRGSTYKAIDRTNLTEECVDIMFFLGSLMELWGIPSTMVAEILERKLIENKRRLANGYNQVTK